MARQKRTRWVGRKLTTPVDSSADDENGDDNTPRGLVIAVNKDWRMLHDGLQFRVQQRTVRETGQKAGQEHWKNRAYCSTLDSAVWYFATRRIYALPGTWGGCDAIEVLGNALDTIKAECKAAVAEAVAARAPL